VELRTSLRKLKNRFYQNNGTNAIAPKQKLLLKIFLSINLSVSRLDMQEMFSKSGSVFFDELDYFVPLIKRYFSIVFTLNDPFKNAREISNPMAIHEFEDILRFPNFPCSLGLFWGFPFPFLGMI